MYNEYESETTDIGFSTPITVSQLNAVVKEIFDNIPYFRDIYIQGEISNFKNHFATGHFYFTLKDESSSIKAVMFKANASRVKFIPENGMKVTIHGRVSVFPRDGQYQIYCESMEPLGIGSLYQAFEQLKAKLLKEGLFDETVKKPLPAMPKIVGVVTSATGAAVRDIINVLGRRCPMTKVLIYPCLVQGEDAAESVISGIRYFNETNSVDVMIIGRGGGSIEDLWAFNNEDLARAIYASVIPVISAVGHETDFTIADFVADVRAPTPSAAAEIAVPDISELNLYLSTIYSRLNSLMVTKTEKLCERLARFSNSKVLCDPMAYINEKNMSLILICEKLEEAMNRLVEKKKTDLTKNAALLNSLSPLAVLSRGYGVVMDMSGKPVASVCDTEIGETIKVKVCDGNIMAEVKRIETE